MIGLIVDIVTPKSNVENSPAWAGIKSIIASLSLYQRYLLYLGLSRDMKVYQRPLM